MTTDNSHKSIELHIIHSFPATNLNRDDTGNPKDCVFGGAHRLRVSSQCFKRAIRHHPVFEATTGVDSGTRTKRLALEWLKPFLVDELAKLGKRKSETEAQADLLALYFSRNYSSKKQEMYSEDPTLTKTLLYLSDEELNWVTAQLVMQWDELVPEAQVAMATKSDVDEYQQTDDAVQQGGKAKKGKKKDKKEKSRMDLLVDKLVATHANRTSAPDIALFGRMLADRPNTNIDAAVQLAHAISTHAVKTETDFYTAVDDLKPGDTPGADMIGTIAFGAACYYRYARLDWNKLVKNLKGNPELAEKTVEAFLLASEAANPSGMGNSHDNNTRPSLLLAVVRDDTKGAPWSLVNAFEEPVFSRDGYVNASVKRMEDHWDGLTQFYGTDSVKVVAVAAHPGVIVNGTFDAAKKTSLNEWVDAVMQGLK